MNCKSLFTEWCRLKVFDFLSGEGGQGDKGTRGQGAKGTRHHEYYDFFIIFIMTQAITACALFLIPDSSDIGVLHAL
ncbi:hypothetical protein CEV08_06695 [Bartonella tribocorum]|uniref:Uncharacterized protein n=1 Tax=Bartonella tribocorum TaxID=85701 RepID=A0A2M6USJ5_9HYPH|nr:hypothetical protein [Bartonella tribocorum]PIT69160.1 hypothetical protein CEV08_06695 [Bartonella tribocorum]